MVIPETVFAEILADIAAGEPAYKSAESRGVNRKKFWAYVGSDDAAANRYARAKVSGLERLADEIVEISDDGANDTYLDDDGNEKTNHDVIARSRLRVDSRKWLLSKLAPKKYGDRTILAGDADNPLQIVGDSTLASKLLPELAAGGPTEAPGGSDEG